MLQQLLLQILSLMLCVCSGVALASPHRATVVAKKGEVKILSNPMKEVGGRKKVVLYEGRYYTHKPAKVGTKVALGDVVKTGTDGRAKLIFANGDQFTLGRGTAYRLLASSGSEGKADKSMIHLFYGKMRSVISKKGPRKKLKVRTKTAVAGVRGTDFYIRDTSIRTGVTVLRGAVAVQERSKKTAQVKEIKPGFSASVGDKMSDIKIEKASKQELLKVQAASSVEPADLKEVPKEVQDEVKQLEKAAVDVVLQDIKEEDPNLYEVLKGEQIQKTDEVNTLVVSKLYKKAPGKAEKRKPSLKELEGLGDDVYEKYFQ